jgi:hypothetical protein
MAKVLYVEQVEKKEAFAYNVKVKRRHGQTTRFPFSDKENIIGTEREDTVTKFPRPLVSGGTARTATLKYCSVNFLREELCRQGNGVLLWTLNAFKFIYFSIILFVLRSAPLAVQMLPKHGAEIYRTQRQRYILITSKCDLIL